MSFGFGGGKGFVAVQSGKSNGRSVYQDVLEGRVTITGTDAEGKNFQRVFQLANGEVQDNTYRLNGRLVHRIVYGKFEHTPSNGREIVRFHRGGKGKHGKSRRFEKLFGVPGVCHSWFKNGRLVRQKFIYDNGRLAYDYKARTAGCVIKASDGSMLYRVKGLLDGRSGGYINQGHSVFAREDRLQWFLHTAPVEVERKGTVVLKGEFRNGQRVGRWIMPDSATLAETFGVVERDTGRVQEVFFEHGVAIPKDLYQTPPERLNPVTLLKIPNAQLRMAMMARANVKPARLARECGRVIHKQGDMRLYAIPGLDTRILKVVCPSTKSQYFIHVPDDSTKCEQARQWTFHVGAGVHQPIKFTKET